MIVFAALLLMVSASVADKAPTFCLLDLARHKTCLEELMGKGPVVLDFWATWCGPCVKALPHLQVLSEEFADRGVTVVGICADSPKTVSRVPGFVNARKLTFPILMDTDNEVMRSFKVANLPYTCVIDTGGVIVYSHLGYKPGDEKKLREAILSVLDETGGEPR